MFGFVLDGTASLAVSDGAGASDDGASKQELAAGDAFVIPNGASFRFLDMDGGFRLLRAVLNEGGET